MKTISTVIPIISMVLLVYGCVLDEAAKEVEFETITIEDLKELENADKKTATNVIDAIKRLSDSDLCEEISNETFTGKKYICLKGTKRGCLKWSEEQLGKESFIQELHRRYSGAENCESINKRMQETEKSSPRFVLIDTRKPEYCALISFSDPRFLLKIEKIPRDQLVKMALDFNQFRSDPDRYLDRCVIINEYKKYNYRKYFPKLLEKFKNTPFGLTWNGGLAFTWNDYRQAEILYEDYKSDPGNYSDNSIRSFPGDPINPGQHLPAFLPYSSY